MSALIYLLFGLTIAVNSSQAYKALVVYPIMSKSHGILGDAIVKQLLKEGHEVTYLTFYEYKNPPPNLRQINVSANMAAFPGKYLKLTTSLIPILNGIMPTNDRNLVMHVMINVVEKTIEIKEVQDLMSDPKERFDVVIAEWMFADIYSSFAAVFECPLIWTSSMEVNARVLRLIDAMPNPAYSSDILSFIAAPFTFCQRLEEVWRRITEAVMDCVYYDKLQNDAYEKYFVPHIKARGRNPPSFQELRFNASLILANSHVSMGEALATPQNYKAVGGFHIEDNVKPLPEDLKKIMDSSKDGVIYFSMGSNLLSKDLPEEMKQNLLKMFGELKQTVLWKFEENLPNKPKNVHILQWAPQPSILSHPNCILFITHGGLLSTTETIHYGVPVIGIPVFGDQFVNVNIAARKSFALKVDLTYNLAKDLSVAIKEILSNPAYRTAVKELSYVYHNRPVKPIQELSHWVGHVVETRGALHLRSPALKVPLYQRLFLDLIALIGISIFVICKLGRRVCALTCSKKAIDVNKKKN